MNVLDINGVVFAEVMELPRPELVEFDESVYPSMEFYNQLLDNRVDPKPVEVILPVPEHVVVPWTNFGKCSLFFSGNIAYAVAEANDLFVMIAQPNSQITNETQLNTFLKSINGLLDMAYQQGATGAVPSTFVITAA